MGEVCVEQVDDGYRVEGTLSQHNLADLDQFLLQQVPVAAVTLDLRELDIEDRIALIHTVDLIRHFLNKVDKMVLQGSPQLLAHTLYRVGMLQPGTRLVLLDTREEEPYG